MSKTGKRITRLHQQLSSLELELVGKANEFNRATKPKHRDLLTEELKHLEMKKNSLKEQIDQELRHLPDAQRQRFLMGKEDREKLKEADLSSTAHQITHTRTEVSSCLNCSLPLPPERKTFCSMKCQVEYRREHGSIPRPVNPDNYGVKPYVLDDPDRDEDDDE